jgi:peptidyl-prolyl cis-trans isomerase C
LAQADTTKSDLMIKRLAIDSGLSEQDAKKMRDQLKSELAMRELLEEKAVAEGLDRSPDVAASIELARQNALARAFLDRLEQSLIPAAEDIVSDYESAYPVKKQALAKIAIFAKEDIAAKHLAAVASGMASFEDVAAKADDELVARERGSFGWLAWDALPDEVAAQFDASAARLPSAPIKTRYGYVIYDLQEKKSEREKEFEAAKSDLIGKRKQLMMRVELGKIKEQAETMVKAKDAEATFLANKAILARQRAIEEGASEK